MEILCDWVHTNVVQFLVSKKRTHNQRTAGSGYFKTLKEQQRFHERFYSFLSNYF
jgi:hypothetical protein